MKKTIIIFYCVLAAFFYSCKKEHVDPELVYVSHISPQQALTTVYVGLQDRVDGSKDLYNQIDVKGQAIVSILNNSSLYKLEYDAASDLYVIDSAQLKIRAGSKYTLVVAVKDKKASASTTIPALNNSVTYKIDSLNGNNFIINASWQDTPDLNSIYKLEVTYLTYWGTTYKEKTDWIFVADTSNPGGVITAKLPFEFLHLPNQTITATFSALSPEYTKWLWESSKAGPGHVPPGETNSFVGLNSYSVIIKP